MPFETIQSTRIYQQIASKISDMIRTGELRPSDRLPGEHDLARRFGVSRGPVREAIIALETVGFVEVRNGNGTFIRQDFDGSIGLDWARSFESDPGPLEQFEMREILEPEAAARAAPRITEPELTSLRDLLGRMESNYPLRNSYEEGSAFIRLIGAASGNSVLSSLIDELWRLKGGKLWGTLRERVIDAEHRRLSIEERKKILSALEARDPGAARSATQSYLAVSKGFYFGELNGTG